MNDIRIVHALPKEEWRRFVDLNPNGNIFHTPELFEVYTRTKGYEPTLWAAVNEVGRILVLLLPVRITLRSGLMRYLTTRAVVFGGILWEAGAEGERALTLLLRNYRLEADRPPLFTELRNLYEVHSTLSSTFREQGFVYEEHLNYLIDLDGSPDEIFARIGARTRKNIRRGLNRGEVVVEEVKNCDQIAGCYDLLKKTYRMAHVPLADYSLFETAFEVLAPKNMIRISRARVGNACIATSIELVYKDVVYGWYGGLDRDYGNFMPNELLMWNILQWGSEKGYRVYDFGGAGKPGEKYGVRDFKSKFGGQLVNFGRYTLIHSPLMFWISKIGYKVVRKLI